jgi:hypothetical protein
MALTNEELQQLKRLLDESLVVQASRLRADWQQDIQQSNEELRNYLREDTRQNNEELRAAWRADIKENNSVLRESWREEIRAALQEQNKELTRIFKETFEALDKTFPSREQFERLKKS